MKRPQFQLFLALILQAALGMCVGCDEKVQLDKELFLAKRGQALLPIFICADAIPAELTAAQELSKYLEKITGAKFRVLAEPPLRASVPAIYIGNTELARSRGINITQLGPEESVLRTMGTSLLLTGGRPRGTLYAVYELLENTLGVRWYTPWCEKVPPRPTCAIPAMNKRVRPYLTFRSQYTYLGDPDPDGGRFINFKKDQWKMFNVRNKLNVLNLDASVGGGLSCGGRVGGGHGLSPYLPPEKYFKDHPEYYSLRKVGESWQRVPCASNGNHACLTNPDVLPIIIEEVKKDIAKDIAEHKDAICYTVAVEDGGCRTICDCTPCRAKAEKYGADPDPYNKISSDSGLMLWFVNKVADAIKAQYPDKFIRTLAYSAAYLPPTNICANDNVLVHVCNGRSGQVWMPQGIHFIGDDEVLKRWCALAKHVWIWDYADANFSRPAFFHPITWRMADQFKFYKSLGVIDGIFQENPDLMDDSFFNQFYEMNMWIFMKLCQNPDLHVENLMSDFVNGYYEKAGPAILSYLSLVHAHLPGIPDKTFDYEFMSQAQNLFDDAQSAVKANPEILGRVKDLRIQLDLLALIWRNTIIRDYLGHGGKLVKYPWRRCTLKTRLLDTLNTTQHLYILGKAPRYDEYAKEKGDIEIKKIVKGYICAVGAGVDYTPLPKEVSSFAPSQIIDLTAPLFGAYVGVVPDKDATLGIAVDLSNNKFGAAMVMGSYHVKERQDGGGQNLVSSDKKPGYIVYTGPQVSLKEWTYIYTATWALQTHLWTLHDPTNPDQKYNTYVSMKRIDPENNPGAIYVDRLILVKVSK